MLREAAAAMGESFESARARLPVTTVDILVADQRIQLQVAGARLAKKLLRAVAHLMLAATDIQTVDDRRLVLHISDQASVAAPIPKVLLAHADEPGSSPVYRGGGYTLEVHRPGGIVSLLDANTSVAYWSLTDAEEVPPNDVAYPAQHVFQWWMAQHGWHLVHASAVAMNCRGIIATGDSGTGKSTLARLCLAAGFRYLGDDLVLVGDGPVLHSLYNSSRMSPAFLRAHPELQMESEESGEDKVVSYVAETEPESVLSSCALAAIVLPRAAPDERTVCHRTAPSEAMLSLVRNGVLHLPGTAPEAFSLLASVARQVPTVDLVMGADVATIPEVVAQLLGEA